MPSPQPPSPGAAPLAAGLCGCPVGLCPLGSQFESTADALDLAARLCGCPVNRVVLRYAATGGVVYDAAEWSHDAPAAAAALRAAGLPPPEVCGGCGRLGWRGLCGRWVVPPPPPPHTGGAGPPPPARSLAGALRGAAGPLREMLAAASPLLRAPPGDLAVAAAGGALPRPPAALVRVRDRQKGDVFAVRNVLNAGDLKEKIVDSIDINEEFRILYLGQMVGSGRYLGEVVGDDDGRALSDYGIRDGSTVDIVFHFQPGTCDQLSSRGPLYGLVVSPAPGARLGALARATGAMGSVSFGVRQESGNMWVGGDGTPTTDPAPGRDSPSAYDVLALGGVRLSVLPRLHLYQPPDGGAPCVVARATAVALLRALLRWGLGAQAAADAAVRFAAVPPAALTRAGLCGAGLCSHPSPLGGPPRVFGLPGEPVELQRLRPSVGENRAVLRFRAAAPLPPGRTFRVDSFLGPGVPGARPFARSWHFTTHRAAGGEGQGDEGGEVSGAGVCLRP